MYLVIRHLELRILSIQNAVIMSFVALSNVSIKKADCALIYIASDVVIVVFLFNVHGKQLWSCPNSQLT